MLLFPTWLGGELEGHLLNHKSVADVCLVPLQYDYSGEVPIAFSTQEKLQHGNEEAKLKAEAIKVSSVPWPCDLCTL